MKRSVHGLVELASEVLRTLNDALTPAAKTDEDYVRHVLFSFMGEGPSDEIVQIWTNVFRMNDPISCIRSTLSALTSADGAPTDLSREDVLIAFFNAFLGRDPNKNELLAWMYVPREREPEDYANEMFAEFVSSKEFIERAKCYGMFNLSVV
jgi:hypothetical protein